MTQRSRRVDHIIVFLAGSALKNSGAEEPGVASVKGRVRIGEEKIRERRGGTI